MSDPLAHFTPQVREWFGRAFAAPTAAQAQAWPAIATGEHVLISAPTGSGKTLAAFLWGLDKLSGRVEADETFIGPDPAKMHAKRRARLTESRTETERYVSKAVVAGLLDRAKGRVHAEVVPNVQAHTLAPIIRERVEPGAEMITDMLRSYWQIRDTYIHSVIDKTKMYVKGHVHTNGLENFWSLLKRALRGTYIAVDAFHLHRYVDEQAVWTLMRLADEPAERVPSRQISRIAWADPRGAFSIEPGEFDQAFKELADDDDLDDLGGQG